VTSALLVGLDFAVREDFLRILGDPPAGTEHDRLAEMLSQNAVPAVPLLGRVLAAAWRAALARGFHRRVAWVRVDQLKGAPGQQGCDLSMATFVRVEEHLSGEEA
jgi:hypothetical protein